MGPVKIQVKQGMKNFLIRNKFCHEPSHDFNPIGTGSRYLKLNSQLENLKIIGQEGGKIETGKDNMLGGDPRQELLQWLNSPTSTGSDRDKISDHHDMDDGSPSDTFNTEAQENKTSTLAKEYGNFLSMFDVNAVEMNKVNTLHTERIVTRQALSSIFQARAKSINAIQIITDMTDYIRLFAIGYIEPSTSIGGMKRGGRIDLKRPTPYLETTKPYNGFPKKEAMNMIEPENPTKITIDSMEDRSKEYSYFYDGLTSIIREFEELESLNDGPLIDLFPIEVEISRPALEKSKNIFVFYRYMFDYYITNINNTFSAYQVNDTLFARDAIFFYMIHSFNDRTTDFLKLDDKEKDSVLSEIFNLRIPQGGNDYLSSTKKTDLIKETQKGKGPNEKQHGGVGIDELSLGLAIASKARDDTFLQISKEDNNNIKIGETVVDLNVVNGIENAFRTSIEAFFTEIIGSVGSYNVTDSDAATTNIQNIQASVIKKATELITKNTKIDTAINDLKKPKTRGNPLGKILTEIPELVRPVKALIIRLVICYNKIKPIGKREKTLSSDASKRVNIVLQKICQNIEAVIGDDGDLKNPVFKEEKNLISEIVVNGKVPSTLDGRLYDSCKVFLKGYNDNTLLRNKQIGEGQIQEIVTTIHETCGDFSKPTKDSIYITNNALTSTGSDNQKVIEKLANDPNFKVICSIPSIMDAQGSFGSCNFGIKKTQTQINRHNAEVIPTDLEVSIMEEGREEGFFSTLNINSKSNNNTTKVIVEYNIRVIDANEKDHNIRGEIKVAIRDKAVDILSAKNVITKVFDDIVTKGYDTLNGYLDENIWTVSECLLQKFYGDYGQELYALAHGFGRPGIGEKEGINKEDDKQISLLTNGDRPSMVRACMLKIWAAKQGNSIKDGSYILYGSPKEYLLFGGKLQDTQNGGNRKQYHQQIKMSKKAKKSIIINKSKKAHKIRKAITCKRENKGHKTKRNRK
jgi:hypothetical protein